MNHNLIYCPEDFLTPMKRVRFQPGETIVQFNAVPHFVYGVLDGLVNVTYFSSRGKKVIASQFVPGDYIGDLNVVCSQNFLFEAQALSEVHAIQIPADLFLERMETDFRLTKSILQSQNNRINFLESYSIINRTFGLYERLVLFLLIYFPGSSHQKHFTKEYIAACIDTDIRSLNRVLKEMEEKGLVLVKRGNISGLNKDQLQEEARNLDIDYQIGVFFNSIWDDLPPVNFGRSND